MCFYSFLSLCGVVNCNLGDGKNNETVRIYFSIKRTLLKIYLQSFTFATNLSCFYIFLPKIDVTITKFKQNETV